MGGEFTERRSD